MTDETEPIDLRIELEEDPPRGRFKLVDESGNVLGEMRLRRESSDLIVIEHTEVDGSLRGKQGGRRFFEGVVAWARQTGTRIRSECPFTTSMFDRNPSSRDVLG